MDDTFCRLQKNLVINGISCELERTQLQMSGWQIWVTMFLKFSVKVKVMNIVNFSERDLLFYIYASLVAFLEWITPPCLSTRIFYSDCYNLIRNFIWIFLLLLLSYIMIPIVQLEYKIGVQFYYTRVQSNYF